MVDPNPVVQDHGHDVHIPVKTSCCNSVMEHTTRTESSVNNKFIVVTSGRKVLHQIHMTELLNRTLPLPRLLNPFRIYTPPRYPSLPRHQATANEKQYTATSG